MQHDIFDHVMQLELAASDANDIINGTTAFV